MTEDDSLPSDVVDLLGHEKDDVSSPPGARARVRARVRATLGSGGPGEGGSESSRAQLPSRSGSSLARRLAPHVFTFVLGAATATAVMRARQPAALAPRVVYVERAPIAPVPNVPVAAPSEEPTIPAVRELVETRPPRVPGKARPPVAFGQLAAERARLDVARSALVRGEPEAARVALDEHARILPSGLLTEEREAMRVQLLMMSSRYDEARARGNRFLERFPNSVLRPAIEAALQSIP